MRAFCIKYLRVVLLAIRGFTEKKCQLKASALTFNTLLSIVPVAAIAFGIAKGFGYQEVLREQLLERFSTLKEVLLQVMNFALALLETTRGGVVAGCGLLVLFYSVVKVLGTIEDSFNDIWGFTQSRSFMRTFSDYTSVILLAPLLLIMSGSATVFVSTQVQLMAERFSLLGPLAPLVVLFLKSLSYVSVWCRSFTLTRVCGPRLVRPADRLLCMNVRPGFDCFSHRKGTPVIAVPTGT